MSQLPHVVILGAGFGGIGAIEKLRDSKVRITIVDKHDYHTFQPLLYQVATDELGPTEVGFPVRELLHRHENTTFHQGMIRSVDLAAKQVTVDGIEPLKYDYLILALGGVVTFFGTPGAQEHALPMYTMEDAIKLKEHVLRKFEAVDKNPKLVDEGALNFVIVGGGPTGVELAGAMAELLRAELKEDYPNLPVEKARILLYEHSPHLLGPFKPKLQEYAQQALTERGVEIHTGTGVSRVDAEEIALANGETVKTRTLVWAAGLSANPVTSTLGVETVHGGRIPVGPDLQVKDHSGVFAIGDCAAMTDGKTGQPLPGLAAVALQAGRYVGEAINELLAGKKPQPFHYVNKGTMAQVGRGAAVVELPFGGTLTGHVAWLAWLGVHLSLLSGAEEKTSVFVDWGWNVLTHKRGKRIILGNEGESSGNR